VPSWEKMRSPVGIKISSKEDNCSLYKETTDKEDTGNKNMSHDHHSGANNPNPNNNNNNKK